MTSKPIERTVVDGQESIVIESTLPPTSTRQIYADEGATILVFSHDAGLARVIRNVAADRYPFRVIDQWSDLLKPVGSGQGRIVLLDVDALKNDVEEALTELNRCADWLVIIIAARQNQAQDFMKFWSERRIHRLLIKPAAAGITRLLLESAFARFIELRELHENTDSMEIPPELLEVEDEPPKRSWFRFVAVAAVVLAAAGLGIWYSGILNVAEPTNAAGAEFAVLNAPRANSEGGPDREATAEPGAVAAAADVAGGGSESAQPLDPYEETLLKARAAELRGRLVEPADDNALDYYMSVLIRDPDHALARERLDLILEDLFVAAEAQILEKDFQAAESTLEQISRGNPSGTRLLFLNEQLLQLREAEAALEVARQTSADAPPQATSSESAAVPQTELQSITTLARLRLDEGALIEPAGDSARDYILRAVDLGIEAAELNSLVEGFSARAAAAIPLALDNGDADAAEALLRIAYDLGAQEPELAALEADIEAALSAQSVELDQALHAQALLSIDAADYAGTAASAAELLGQLRARGTAVELISDLEAKLTNALSRSVREAIGAQRWEDAEALLAAFGVAQLDSAVVRGLQRDLTFAQRQREFLDEVAPIGALTVLETEPAEYPRAALLADVSGWVDLHFTVGIDGVPKAIEVVAADPAGEFEEAAIAAVAQYRFEPFQFESRRYERRVGLRMRFELD